MQAHFSYLPVKPNPAMMPAMWLSNLNPGKGLKILDCFQEKKCADNAGANKGDRANQSWWLDQSYVGNRF